MSIGGKYMVSKALVAITIPIMCFSLARMIPAGLGGETHIVKIWFGVCFVTLAIGVISFVAMRRNKSRIENPDQDAIDTLSVATRDLSVEKRAVEAEKTEYTHK